MYRLFFDAYGWSDLWNQLQTGKTAPKTAKTVNEQILQRLVDLNAQRAEEERNGHIRWLRPEYQAPDEVQQPAETQTTLAVVLPEAEPEPVVPVEQQKWPTKPKDQLAAISSLLSSSTGQWTPRQLAAQFKGKITQKKLSAINESLDMLEYFSRALSRTDPATGITHWQSTEASQAAQPQEPRDKLEPRSI